MKLELLAPAGNFECLKNAIKAGCDAVYLSGKNFTARAFSNNFTNEELIKAINYAHLYNVKVYVTVNTLIYDDEIEELLEYVDFLYKNNVDALIIQDIGIMDLIRKTYPLLELHASTQMHIHNIEGVKLVEKLGLKRVVLARETNIETIKHIKQNTNIELEVFVHGSLCVSYSGQCLMSSLIGNRSGNRGSCVGCCRLKYTYKNQNKYFLSMKDLCTVYDIGKLIDSGVTSFKIEGRMKSPSYVYMVTKIYRKAIDAYINHEKLNIKKELEELKTIFNREYTNGFLFNAKNNEITNNFRPNHLGNPIGKVIDYKNDQVYIKLDKPLNQKDGIRIVDNDIGFTVINMYKNNKKIKSIEKGVVSIPLKDKVKINSVVVKTNDYLLNKKIEEIPDKKISIDVKIEAKVNHPFKIKAKDGINEVEIIGDILSKAKTQIVTKEKIKEQLSKLGDSIYKLNKIEIISDDIFIPIQQLNEYRRKMVNELNEKRLYKKKYLKKEYSIEVDDFPITNNVNYYISNIKQYNLIKDKKINDIYLESDLYDKINDERKVLKLERVINEHKNYNQQLLVGELGSLKPGVYTDFSLNVTNSYAVAFLHSLGVKKITLSYELTDKKIKEIINNYTERYNKHPNLEVIVYGKEEAMISKFILDKEENTYLIDKFNNKFLIRNKNNLMKIYNYKPRKLKTNYFEMGINNIRYNLIDETSLDSYFVNKK